KVVPLVCPSSILSDAIDVAYGCASSIDEILGELDNGEGGDTNDLSDLDDGAFAHPIVRLVNALVFEAVKLGASDLHFEPEENFVRLRYRKDGTLFTAQIIHKEHWSGISQRIKIMSKMNIANKLIPQDGRFGMSVNGREADFRVSSLPTVHGENIVLRVLDQSSSIMAMEKLGFSEHNVKLINASQAKPEGIIIVTGPTGSGKTTSLYSMLNEINTVDVNIQTLEDPVEYSLPMIRQTHVKEGVLEFADGIKALLRQDPDIIFIGEIRDAETAGMALKAAMTGHQVYTTLHTNDSFGAIPRLFDLGLKPGMVAGAIVSIFAQRLVRVLCKDCKQSYKPDEDECKILGVDPAKPPRIHKAKEGGCGMCEGTGYKGRSAVVEILMFDEELDELLARGESKADIKALAVKKGFKSMKDDGIIKVLEGKTSLEALAKVVDVNK
ncbi:MAG: type II/IV secretion system protein, partial [Alphaproteobacteria bacterium]|nr:type II/IV secretion system protein [Alphaproteobacteria bacterium]